MFRINAPLVSSGAELLSEVLSQRYERSSRLVTSNLPFQGMD
jgi:DNA replication protein DnaC